MPTAIYRLTDPETYELAPTFDLPDEGTTLDITEGNAGSLTYLHGTIDVDSATLTAYFTDESARPSDRFALIDGTYVHIWSVITTLEGGRLFLNQSWQTEWAPEGETPIPLDLVEPSPPVSPFVWYFADCARAYAEATA